MTKAIQVIIYVGDEMIVGTSTNFGPTGILVMTDDPPMLGEIVKLKIRFPDLPNPIELQGEVVWTNPFAPGDQAVPKGCGIKFKGITPDLQSLLSNLSFTYHPTGDPLRFFYS